MSVYDYALYVDVCFHSHLSEILSSLVEILLGDSSSSLSAC